MRKCRSKAREEHAGGQEGFFQGHGIRKVWGQIQSSVSPALYPDDTQKAACGPRRTPVSSLAAPTPFTSPLQGPQPGPLLSPPPSWQKGAKEKKGDRAHFTPRRKALRCRLWGRRCASVPGAQRGRGRETPFTAAPSSSSRPAFIIIPLQRPPPPPRSPSQKSHLTDDPYLAALGTATGDLELV